MRARVLLILAIAFAALAAEAGGPVIPDGWHDQSTARTIEDQVAEKALVVGDFDGNGMTDGASLAATDDGKEQGLLVFMYFPNRKHEKWFVVQRWPSSGTSMAIELAKPGVQRVLCSASEKCKRKTITLKTDAVRLYQPEGAASLIVWNVKQKGFDQIWASD